MAVKVTNPGGGVSSVNGQVDDVELIAADVPFDDTVFDPGSGLEGEDVQAILESIVNGFTSTILGILSSLSALEPITDTKANILATSPTGAVVAYAQDTDEFLLYDGTDWKIASIKMSTETEAPDVGWSQDSDQRGYGDDYIQGKRAYDFSIGDFTDDPFNGALRVDRSNTPATFELYIRDRWYQIVYDINMDNGQLEHAPAEERIQVRSGNSVSTGLNNQPIVQQYQVDIGAYPYPTIIDGGTF